MTPDHDLLTDQMFQAKESMTQQLPDFTECGICSIFLCYFFLLMHRTVHVIADNIFIKELNNTIKKSY
jgi:hypothetical protein